ncbi:phosphatase PAP2 family protein [Roseibacillus persicicus]|uniref:phosphatase PAP2 family protein n=1 Tax=Roseibacillus persicicus TaxID=454148 RepID=UPI00398AAD2F
MTEASRVTKVTADKWPQASQPLVVRAAIYLPIAILAALSLPFLFSDLDLALQEPFYGGDNQWPVGDSPIWRFFYTIGPVPAILLGVVSIFTLMLGFGNQSLAKYRKLSAYFFFVLLIGAGLITNSILKDQWGRPRPKQVTAFDGTESFERLLHYEPESTGKSFPCGHATVGFYFLALVPLLKGRRRWWALILSLLLGLLIGIARMTQGGHFASDVIWAAAVMWFTSLLFYKLLRLDQSLYWQAKEGTKPLPKWVRWASAPVVVLILALVGTIWPYDKRLTATPDDLPPLEELRLDFNGEDILEIVPGKEFSITSFTDGHRAPKSRLRASSTFSDGPPTIRVDYRREGFFSELNVRTVVTVPEGLSLTIVGSEELTRLVLPKEGIEPQLELSPETKVLKR